MPRPTIVFLDAATLGEVPNLHRLAELGNFTAHDFTQPSEVVARLSNATVAITNKVVIGAAEMAQLPHLRLICVAATGTNNIDKNAAQQHDISVKNVAGYSTNAVAQLTLTSLFTVAMDLIHLNAAVYDGTYSKAPSFSYWRRPFYELGGATYGIIGMGAIGQRVAELATAYGAKVVYHSTSGHNTGQPYPHLALEELLGSCEVLSIHAPLNDQTTDLITARELQLMKPSAYLLNMGRGGIVNEADLAHAIDQNWIAGAAVDVFTQEPLPPDHSFLQVKNKHKLLLTPHVGWASVEARMTLVNGLVNHILQFTTVN